MINKYLHALTVNSVSFIITQNVSTITEKAGFNMKHATPEKKYQIFISSTYEDLKEERSAICMALLDLGHIPIGMEQFPASSMNAMDYIQKILSTCDYYILILAGRYGSIDPSDDTGYTEKEYDYAIQQNIPIMSFVYRDIQNLQNSKCEQTEKGKTKLDQFRKKVMANTLCRMYSSSDQLPFLVASSLQQCIQSHPAIGWVRADTVETKASPSDYSTIDINNLSSYTDSQIEDALDQCNNATRRTICYELISTNRNTKTIEKCIASMTNDAEKYKLLEKLAHNGYSDSYYFYTIIKSTNNAKYLRDTLQLCIQEQKDNYIEECFNMIKNNEYVFKVLPLIYNYDQTLFYRLYDNGNCFSNAVYKHKAEQWLTQMVRK